MDFIIDFYKELETLDLIIFWGIIIVIVLLLIFALILISKNRKLKKIMHQNKNTYINNNFEGLPIKDEKELKTELEEKKTNSKGNEIYINRENKDLNSIVLPEIPAKENENQEIIINPIETEQKFIAEEHVIEYNKDLFSSSNIEKTNDTEEVKPNHNIKNKQPIKMPTGPYQRNVLREMSLSQTSPIGITIPKEKEEKRINMAIDLEKTLNTELKENNYKKEIMQEENKKELIEPKKEELIKQQEKNNPKEEKEIIKKELNEIKNNSQRKTEIKKEIIPQQDFDYKEKNMLTDKTKNEESNIKKNIEKIEIHTTTKKEESEKINRLEKSNIEQEKLKEKTVTKTNLKSTKEIIEKNVNQETEELFNNIKETIETPISKNSSEKYLEEVSRKLAEAEIPDEIERTDYELEQEENAIISFKELMEKKDSIQTIDEEEAIISIEELMNRSNSKEEQNKTKEDSKLYKLTEEEENDDFIKELKQFRNDL